MSTDGWDEAQEGAWEQERDLAAAERATADALRVDPEDRCGALACGLALDGFCYRSWGCEVGT